MTDLRRFGQDPISVPWENCTRGSFLDSRQGSLCEKRAVFLPFLGIAFLTKMSRILRTGGLILGLIPF